MALHFGPQLPCFCKRYVAFFPPLYGRGNIAISVFPQYAFPRFSALKFMCILIDMAHTP